MCCTAWLAALAFFATGSLAGKKKPLFEYDDHYVMLNDRGRNEFYRRALARVVPKCGKGCSVLDVGAGSGLLSMMAAHLGADQVVALEANPDLAALAEKTIERNHDKNFPSSNVTVVALLSSKVGVEQMPHGRQADILVTETFGTMLLGEGAINFVPDARDRLLKPGGIVVPQGGCQYVTLVEVPAISAWTSPGMWAGFNLSHFAVLQDTMYWKATMGASRVPIRRLSERICVLEIDLRTDTKESVPENRTFRTRATQSGMVHAALFDWDVWADESREDIMSSAPGSRNFAGDVAWGWLMQLQEEAGQDWRYGAHPSPIAVTEGEELELGVEFIARAISMHTRVRRASSVPAAGQEPVAVYPRVGSPERMRGVNRGDFIEGNEYYLPMVGDHGRHEFYEAATTAAIKRNSTASPQMTVLDCSSSAGIPSLVAAKKHGLKTVTLTQRNEFAKVLRQVAADNGVDTLMEAYASDPRQFIESLLPGGERVDVAVIDPPGTPLHGLSPFAVLPSIRKYLLKETGTVTPSFACLQVGLVESDDMADMFAVPGKGRAFDDQAGKEDIDFTVWNEQARTGAILERLVPHTKWFGRHSTMVHKWLSPPQCIFEVDFNEYGRAAPQEEDSYTRALSVEVDGRAHGIVARWEVRTGSETDSARLGADSDYFGRSLTWPHYVQAVAAPGTEAGIINPVLVKAGERWDLQVTVRQGKAKVTGAAGPEFTLRLGGKDKEPGSTEL